MSGSLPLDGFNFPSVPSMAIDAQNFVEGLLTDSRTKAAAAIDTANSALTALQAAKLDVSVPDPPTPPTIQTSFTGSVQLGFDSDPDLGSINVADPPQFLPAPPITLPDLTSLIPEYTPLFTSVSIPDAPLPAVVTLPDVPAINTDLTVPDAPVADYGDIPSLETIVIPTFVPPTITPFAGALPTFTAQVPSSAIDWTEPTYNAWIADTLKATLQEMLDGGTGIPVDVERQIWERDRARLDVAAQGKIDEATINFADTRNFPMRPGGLYATIRSILRDSQQEIAKASRDVAIKQAELAQTNRQFAVKSGTELENIFVQIFLATTQRNFDIAKYAVEARIAVFNAEVSAFDIQQKAYELEISQWKAQLDYALAQIQIFKSQIEAEQLKAEVNKELIAAFVAKVQAFTAQADAYRTLVQAATARAEMEKNKIELYKGELEGVQALLGAKKSEYDAFAARIQGETAKTTLEEANSRAFSARVQALSSAAEITVKQADLTIQNSRLSLDWNLGNLQRLGQLAQQQLQGIQARASIYEALTARGTAKFQADRSLTELQITEQMEAAKVLIAYYTAQIEVWKENVTALLTHKEIVSKQLESAAQISATMVAGTLAGSSVSAAFNGTVGRSEQTSQNENYQTTTSTTESTTVGIATNTIINIQG